MKTDVVVIGAGVVGLAVAAQLVGEGREVVVLEQGDHFGEGISSRNSEVIHAGLYYPTESLKARLCVEGRERLYSYCNARGIGHRRLGKWIVASQPDQVAALERIARQAGDNGVPLEWVSRERLHAELPHVTAREALFSPETGIIDTHGLMQSLLADLEAAGGQLVCRTPVLAGESDGQGHRLQIGGESPCDLRATTVINAAGLEGARLAARWEGLPDDYAPESHFARGVYFSYSGRHPFSSLVYPVPEPGGLGVHLTLDMAGQARFGPDVEWIGQPDFTVDPARATQFAGAIRQWWPGVDAGRLQPAYAGVRPKLGGPESGFQDFRVDDASVHGAPGLVHLLGIESPGLTASLALAREVSRRLG